MDGSRAPTVDPAELTRAASDLMSVRRVFGEAYERDGVLVIPVATVVGGTGAGYGSGPLGGAAPAGAASAGPAGPDPDGITGTTGDDVGEGGGGGYGVRVKPIGVYVVDDHGAHWRPALDLNRVILGGQLVGMVAVLAVAWALRRRG